MKFWPYVRQKVELGDRGEAWGRDVSSLVMSALAKITSRLYRPYLIYLYTVSLGFQRVAVQPPPPSASCGSKLSAVSASRRASAVFP
jgi:hypothetical protein